MAKWLPSFTKSAGARFTSIFSDGRDKAIEHKAALTLSLDSAIVLSASPTIVKEGIPFEK
jgi:hypothetical protein